jgi:hypothetical protein
MSQPVLRVLRRALYLFLLILVIITLQIKLAGLPYTLSLRWVYTYYAACLLVSAGYQILQYLYREESEGSRDWEEILKG